MAKCLAFYNSAQPADILACWLVKYHETYGDDVTFVDTTGLDEAGMAGLISGASADTYTDIFVLTGVAATHAAGDFTYDQIASLDGLLTTANKGTATANVITTGTAQSNSTKTNIKLKSGDTAITDEYNNMYIVTAGVTAVYRQITDYDASTKVATVVDTGTAITTTETYKIFELDHVFLYGNTGATGKTVPQTTWEGLFPNTQIPVLVQYLSQYKLFHDYGTAQAAADTTHVTLAASAGVGAVIPNASRANDVYNGMYIYIYSSTNGKNQYTKITDYNNSSKVVVVDAWVQPTGTIIYRIVKNLDRVLVDAYTEKFILTYFNDLTDVDAFNDLVKMIDLSGKLNNDNVNIVEQDLDLLNEYLLKGKAMHDYASL